MGAVILPVLAAGLNAQDRRVEPIGISRRQALVIGNSTYSRGRLQNPANDAQDVGAAMQRLGFNVTVRMDLTRRALDDAINQFARQLGNQDLAFFYYSGHGIQTQGENYLIPIDFQGSSEADVEYEGYAASRVRKKLEETGARIRVMILDACRDNPYHFSRSLSGLAAISSAAEGTLIAYSAGDNQTASDNVEGRNGLYTKYLLSALERPGLGLKEIFEQARADVYAASQRKQFPALYDMIVGRVILRPGAPSVEASPPAPTPPVTGPRSADAEAWDAVRASDSAELYQQFLREYPGSPYAGAARLRLSTLRQSGLVATPSATPPQTTMAAIVQPLPQAPATNQPAQRGAYRIGKMEFSRFAGLGPEDGKDKAAQLFGKSCQSRPLTVMYASGCTKANRIATIGLVGSPTLPQIMLTLAADGQRISSITVFTVGQKRADSGGTDPLLRLLKKKMEEASASLGEPAQKTKDAWSWKAADSGVSLTVQVHKGKCEAITVHW
jgi:uncharacterized caspase-like protein